MKFDKFLVKKTVISDLNFVRSQMTLIKHIQDIYVSFPVVNIAYSFVENWILATLRHVISLLLFTAIFA